MTNGEKIKTILKPRADQIRIYSDWVEIEIQSLSIYFSCELSWWNAECEEPTTKNGSGIDCIDRQDTLDAIIKRLGIKDETYLLEAERRIYQQILAMPPVTPQESRWIPVSERLPEKSGNYWCTFGTNLTGNDYYTTESDAKKLFDDPKEYAGWRSQNVIAWMPLPKGYEEVEE